MFDLAYAFAQVAQRAQPVQPRCTQLVTFSHAHSSWMAWHDSAWARVSADDARDLVDSGWTLLDLVDIDAA